MRGKCPYYCSFAFFYFIKPSWLRCQANSEGINLVMLLVNLSEMWLIWNGAEPSFQINHQLFIALKQAKCVQSNCNCNMQSMPQSTKWILPIWYHNHNTRDLWMIGLCPSSNWSDQIQLILPTFHDLEIFQKHWLLFLMAFINYRADPLQSNAIILTVYLLYLK